MSRIFHRRACQNICSLLVPCHLMARGLKNGNDSFEDDPKAFKQTFQFIIFYFVFSFIASPFPFIQMVMFKIVVARNMNGVRCLQLLCFACAEFYLTKQNRFLLAAHAIYVITYFSRILERKNKMPDLQL